MFLIFLYIILVLYIGFRTIYLVEYFFVNRDMVVDIENRNNNSNSSLEIHLPMPNKSFVNKWRSLYNKDNFVKKIGSSILAIIPLVYFMYNSITGENPSTLIMYIFFPFLLQIVNITFDTIGIDNNLYISNMYKERWLAKRYKKKLKK